MSLTGRAMQLVSRYSGGDGLTQVSGEGSDAALTRQVVADKSDSVDGCLV
jgi:hypothetical protein